MSHSKLTKRGQSWYINNVNPTAKKYINTCYLCGATGYSPAIEEPDFIDSLQRKAIYNKLTQLFDSALPLDSFGRCQNCGKMQDKT